MIPNVSQTCKVQLKKKKHDINNLWLVWTIKQYVVRRSKVVLY